MGRNLVLLSTSLWALGIVGCQAAAPGTDALAGDAAADALTGDAGIDADRDPSEACTLPPLSDDVVYPDGPYGIAEGERLETFAFDDCDGNPVALEQLLAGAELLLVNVAAGWCGPCRQETSSLEEGIFQSFCGRGLRVVQILFEDIDARPVTSLFCNQWQERYGLTLPVLRDPLFRTETLFEDGVVATPLNILTDGTGVVVYRSSGEVDDNLIPRIDEVLP